MINYECLEVFLFMAFVVIVGILGVEYINQRIIKSMQTTIDSLYDHIQMKDKTIELLSVKLREKDAEK